MNNKSLKKLPRFVLLCFVALTVMMFVFQTAEAQKKVTITWPTIAGFYTDWAEEVAKDFEQKTGY